MKIRIQPRESENKVLPYPYFIDEKGFIGRQDFWKGKPKKLLGFYNFPESGDITLMFEDFWVEPERCVGLYPVFEHKNGEWFTSKIPIESIRVERDLEKNNLKT